MDDGGALYSVLWVPTGAHRRRRHQLHGLGSTISAELGLHRDAVSLAVETWRFRSPRLQTSPVPLDPYRDFVRATLKQYPRLRATRLFEMIRERGYTGSVYPLRRHVRNVRPVPAREAFFRLSPLPREEAQVDWGSDFLTQVARSGGHLGGTTTAS